MLHSVLFNRWGVHQAEMLRLDSQLFLRLQLLRHKEYSLSPFQTPVTSIHRVSCVKYLNFCPILTEREFYRQASVKTLIRQFHANPSIESRAVPCGQTNRLTDEAHSFFSELFGECAQNQQQSPEDADKYRNI